MFCSECGSKLPEGAKFCTACGAPIDDDDILHEALGVSAAVAKPSVNSAAPQQSSPQVPPAAPVQPAKSVSSESADGGRKLPLAAIIAAIVVILAIIVIVVFKPFGGKSGGPSNTGGNAASGSNTTANSAAENGGGTSGVNGGQSSNGAVNGESSTGNGGSNGSGSSASNEASGSGNGGSNGNSGSNTSGGSSGNGTTVPEKTMDPQLMRDKANVTAGGAKVFNDGSTIYALTAESILKFDPAEVRAGESHYYYYQYYADYMNYYIDICKFNGKLYALQYISEDDKIALCSIELGDGYNTYKKIAELKDAKENNTYIFSISKDLMYLSIGGKIYSVDKENNIKDTGYERLLFITDEGVYASESPSERKGLKFIPKDGSAKELKFEELSGHKVQLWFEYNSRIYATIDDKPAVIEHMQSISTGKLSFSMIPTGDLLSGRDLKHISLNYLENEDTLLVSLHETAGGEPLSSVYQLDRSTGNYKVLGLGGWVGSEDYYLWAAAAGKEVFMIDPDRSSMYIHWLKDACDGPLTEEKAVDAAKEYAEFRLMANGHGQDYHEEFFGYQMCTGQFQGQTIRFMLYNLYRVDSAEIVILWDGTVIPSDDESFGKYNSCFSVDIENIYRTEELEKLTKDPTYSKGGYGM